MFESNDVSKGGSMYLQAKIYRAKVASQEALQAKAAPIEVDTPETPEAPKSTDKPSQ